MKYDVPLHVEYTKKFILLSNPVAPLRFIYKKKNTLRKNTLTASSDELVLQKYETF